MNNLVDPTTGRTYVQEACLGNLMEWTTHRRILKAMLLSRRNALAPVHFAHLSVAVKRTMDDRTGRVGLTEKQTVERCLAFLVDPKVMRIIARATVKLHGVPFRSALRDLREFKDELIEMVRPRLVIGSLAEAQQALAEAQEPTVAIAPREPPKLTLN